MGLFESIRTLIWCQLFVCALFAFLFSWHSFQGEFLIALMFFSGFLVTSLLLLSNQNWPKKSYLIFSQVIFMVYTFASLLFLLLADQPIASLHLSIFLAYPFLALSLLPFKLALFFILFFSVLVNFLLMVQLEGVFRAAYLTVFWLVNLLTLLYHFSYNAYFEGLKKQLNRDVKTQLLDKSQLLIDLYKEQQRALRESTYLGVIFITNEIDFDLCSVNDVVNCFLPYEGIYSLSPNQLVVLMPLSDNAELKVRESMLVKQLPNLNFNSQSSADQQSLADYLKAYIDKLEVGNG